MCTAIIYGTKPYARGLSWPSTGRQAGNRTTRRQTNFRSVKSRTGQLAD